MRSILILLFVLTTVIAKSQTFTLKSDELSGQATKQQVFNGFGCTGDNVSPQLSWANAPEGTKSFAVTIYDKDAPTGSGWWHWVIFDIDKDINKLLSGAGDPAKDLAPKGVIQSLSDFGMTGYGGPCPPPNHGPHQYTVTIYALKVEKLGLDSNANPALVGYYLNQNVIDKASIVFYYKR
ncbi:YbhB/YbcL family Raf kinase inhibitor-like protein [Fulvivirga sp. 29W222]|uniref:YbhB/YbcL family Raf kinase inhibitor-like protein n=1 Tax=Fulvivirga marina TaxID=2494733 RepID=A0A937FZR3_9BACT|nr:YbhB/YbcL family Raf kinase inhibitor-like protein [Fulvivirga marina]MBL6445871.1 YbhB/YbcL family Raf kinase inhibitor-like protein [Fulvivirga marina]